MRTTKPALLVLSGGLVLFLISSTHMRERSSGDDASDQPYASGSKAREQLLIQTNQSTIGQIRGSNVGSPTPDLAAFKKLLSTEGLRPSMIPELDGTVEDFLISNYHETTNFFLKANTWSILAARGTSSSVPLLTNALLSEFRGQSLGPEMNGRLVVLPFWLGLMASREESIFEFLLAAADPGYWEQRELWRSDIDGSQPRSSRMAGQCLKGLLAFNSNQPEVQILLSDIERDPRRIAEEGLTPAVLSALFWNHTVRRVGPERAFDHLGGDFHLDQYSQWKTETEDGRRWAAWATGWVQQPYTKD